MQMYQTIVSEIGIYFCQNENYTIFLKSGEVDLFLDPKSGSLINYLIEKASGIGFYFFILRRLFCCVILSNMGQICKI